MNFLYRSIIFDEALINNKKSFLSKEIPEPSNSTAKFYQTFKEEMNSNFLDLLKTIVDNSSICVL